MNWKTMLLTRPQGYVTEPIGLFALNYAFKAALLSVKMLLISPTTKTLL